jgi:hypothetical protein
MLHIYIDTIPHDEQRYPTVGDYWHPVLPGGTMTTEIKVSDMGNPDYEFLVALHEQIEAHLCMKRGISDEAITSFDIKFENERTDNMLFDEPGNSKDAPYHKEHVFATSIEKLVAAEIGVSWDDYDTAVNSL